MRWQLRLASALVLVICSVGQAADGNPAFTNAKDAGPDFALQGEYAGSAGDHTWGAHVIALGEGKFNLVGYQGGLPGEGWKRGGETRRAEGEGKDGVATLKGDTFSVSIKDGVMTVKNDGGETLGELKKVERKSPTLGAKPPAGAKVLFDGSTADNFENGKIVEENLLGATGCKSKLPVGDHTLHIEFRTPFMPKSRGQARGNSGVYVQGRYEVQVLDSFGLEGKNNECGGVYQISDPALNMCLPPLAWQTYDIEFRAAKYDGEKKIENARMTVKHNGVIIHDNLDLKDGNGGADKEGPAKNGLYLQDHGNPVAFRNIWVVER